MPTVPVNNNTEVVEGGESDFLRELPQELRDKGVLPENVWLALSPEQKKDILRQNGLLEKYTNQQPEAVEIPIENEVAIVPEEQKVTVMENVKPVDSEIAKMSEQLKESEKKFQEGASKPEEQPALSQEEQKRVAEETAQSSSTMNAPKVFGYQVNSNTVQNANEIAENGNIEDGSTWAATLIKKIFAIFG